jgi:hypothetical protein
MGRILRGMKVLNGREQAVYFHSRERRRSLGGYPELFRTHQFYNAAGSAIAVANIATGTVFPARTELITFRTSITIDDNGGVHAGLVFEFGETTRGCALWLEDDKIGFHAGAAGDADGATALFDNGGELPVGWKLDLVVAARPGDGRVRIWGNGHELARATATNGDFGSPSEWSSNAAGSFAAAPQGTVVSDVPVGSAQAPDGFTVTSPLSAYVKQAPRHFV